MVVNRTAVRYVLGFLGIVGASFLLSILVSYFGTEQAAPQETHANPALEIDTAE